MDPFKDEPPAIERSADAYYLLKGFPRNADDCAAMGAAEIGLDTLLELEMDSDMLKVSTEGNVECLEPAEGEEGEKEAATPLAPSPVVDACTPELGKDGSGLADCAHLKIGVELSKWVDVRNVFLAMAETM